HPRSQVSCRHTCRVSCATQSLIGPPSLSPRHWSIRASRRAASKEMVEPRPFEKETIQSLRRLLGQQRLDRQGGGVGTLTDLRDAQAADGMRDDHVRIAGYARELGDPDGG